MGVETATPRPGDGPLGEADIALLRAAPLFRGLGAEALHALLAGGAVRRLAAGGTLFVQGDPAERFFLLLDGWIKLYRLSADGEEAVVTVIAPGETFAEAASFGSGVYPVCAEAVSPARVLALGLAGVRASIADSPEIAFAMLGSLSFRLRHLVEQIEQLQMKSAAQRLAEFIARLCPAAQGPATLSLPLPKALIARRLGMRPETFSRAMLALRAEGIQQRGAGIEIADVDRLRRFAGTTSTGGCG